MQQQIKPRLSIAATVFLCCSTPDNIVPEKPPSGRVE